jgi:hypothetical protein
MWIRTLDDARPPIAADAKGVYYIGSSNSASGRPLDRHLGTAMRQVDGRCG